MRKLIFLTLLSIPLWAFSQEGTVTSGGTEVAINSSRLISTFLSPGSATLNESNQSIFMLKINGSGTGAVRIGLDLQSVVVKEDNTTSNIGLLNFKFGYEGRTYLSERWDATIGGDIVFQAENSKQETEDPYFGSNEITRKNQRVGAEFVMGIQFKLSDRVKLFTEAYVLGTSDMDETKFSSGSNNKTTGSTIQMIPPSSLYLSVTF